ncbi:iron complex outermembrane receptor protein [Pelomonas saccharophila]|uniref:Iron complex outermembrane receptor protein n=1 Tax=Roseateles saccharophilus TaxID=304 RepID=A0ABU1YFR0_ROSSA|nr:TonB-dependent receptor [Roseateles saccharophilus]MDR7267690.1 iron complex outermembrane receptor protein [Roseateles saccharophilus]
MTMSQDKRGGAASFRISPVAIGCTLLIAATAATAQQEQPQQLETVTVTGIRKAVEAAISVKKNADSIVDAISAEDIGKLPDTSVAESVSRLPGVAQQRNKSTGKASTISIRGMSPDLNGSLFNGREQASTGDSRSPEFDVYPAELLSGIVVHKTPDASLVGQGLSSTVNLTTVQPLNFANRVIAAGYRRQKTGVSSGAPQEGSGDRYSFSYIDQFADRTIGVALAVSRLDERNNQQLKFDSWGGWAADVPYNGSNVKVPGGFKADVETNDNKRDAFLGIFQFRPNKDFKSTVDIFQSRGTNKLKRTGLEGAIPFGASGAGSLSDQYDPAGVLSAATITNGVAASGTMSNYKAVIRNHLTTDKDKLTNFGWNSELKLGDTWSTNLDLSRSKGERHTNRYETTAGQAGNTPASQLASISWTGFNGNNFQDVQYKTSIDFSNPANARLTDVEGWSGGPSSPQAGYLARPVTTDTINNGRLTFTNNTDFGPIRSTSFGVNLSDRKKIRTSDEYRLAIKGGDPYGTAQIPNGSSVVASYSGVPIISWDPTGSEGSIYDLVNKVDEPIRVKFWDVREKVNTAFVKGDLDGELFGLNYRGNVGLQVVHTDQHGGGYSVDKAKCTGNTATTCPAQYVYGDTTYTDVLPSLNVAFDLGGDQVVRLGVAKVLARPVMNDLRAGLSFSLSTPTNGDPAQLTGGGGNPMLKPFRAKSFDLSYEKYFGKKGVISIAGFYKKLDTYIVNIGRRFDFGPYVTGSTPLPPSGSTIGTLTSPFNGSGGNIKGVELNADLPFSLVTSWLDGFGVQINHSDTQSSVKLPISGVNGADLGTLDIPLPGLSRKVTNAKLYYEANGFQIGVARKYRSKFLGEIRDYEDTRKLTFVKGESIIDLQVAYEFQSGPMKGFSVNFSAQNLGNTEFQRFLPDANGNENVVESVKYGKTYLLGVNYKF